MGKLLSELTKEELEILAREQAADIGVLVETKKKVLEKNKQLAAMYVKEKTRNGELLMGLQEAAQTVLVLEAENARLVMLCRNNGLM